MEKKMDVQNMEELSDDQLEATSGGFYFLVFDMPKANTCPRCGSTFQTVTQTGTTTYAKCSCGYELTGPTVS